MSTAAAAASTAWVAASRSPARSSIGICRSGQRLRPRRVASLSYSSARAARTPASARATPAWVAGRSASLRVLSVGVLAPASSARSSSAPRAIPSATAAIDAASRPNGGNA